MCAFQRFSARKLSYFKRAFLPLFSHGWRNEKHHFYQQWTTAPVDEETVPVYREMLHLHWCADTDTRCTHNKTIPFSSLHLPPYIIDEEKTSPKNKKQIDGIAE
jgi:hypothetical protein